MIVTESDRSSSKSTQPTQETSQTTANVRLPRAPPPYQAEPQAVSVPASPTVPLIGNKRIRNEPAWKRFTKAFCLAILIYIFLMIFIMRAVRLTWKHFVHGVPSGPLPQDGRVIRCANETWDQLITWSPFPRIPPYTSTSSFQIPTNSSHIFIFSRGSYGHGSVKLQLSDSLSDSVEIQIITRFLTPESRNHTNICHLARDKDGQGVGIYTPRRIYPDYPGPDDQTSFDITIRFPRSKSSELPLIINSFETKMGIWSHDIESLENLVMFKSLSIASSNTYIRANAISGEFVQLKASNGQISGAYNISNSLVLETSNAAILTTLRLENNDGHKPTRVHMKTSNARIESPITLISTAGSSPAAFSVSAKSSNGPIRVAFPDAPTSIFSHLTYHAKTSNSPVYTMLHSTYEGSISLTTSLFTPSLVHNSIRADPSGNHRRRTLDIRKVLRGVLEAGVWWGDDTSKDDGKGTVEVTTSNGFNKIDLS